MSVTLSFPARTLGMSVCHDGKVVNPAVSRVEKVLASFFVQAMIYLSQDILHDLTNVHTEVMAPGPQGVTDKNFFCIHVANDPSPVSIDYER